MACSLDDVTVEYWSVLAERRRLALAEALEENMGLHEEVESLKNQVDTLKTENALLKPLAEEAKYLAGVLKVTCFFKNTFLLGSFLNSRFVLTGSSWRC